MPYRLSSPREPKARPGDLEHEHPQEPAGKTFTAVKVKDRGEKGIWLLSAEKGQHPYPDKWYRFDWCEKTVASVDETVPPIGELEDLEKSILVVMRALKALWKMA